MTNIGDLLIGSRLLVVQSKRCLLSSAQRHPHLEGTSKKSVARWQADVAAAEHRYTKTVLDWADPDSQLYQRTAYGRLSHLGQQLIDASAAGHPDIPRLELATDSWRSRLARSVEAA